MRSGRSNGLALAAVAIALALTGCFDAAGPSSGETTRVKGGSPFGLDEQGRPNIDPEWAEKVVEGSFNETHVHTDPDHHKNLSTPNFHELGWNPLITDWYGTTSAMHLCGDTSERDGRALSVVHSWGSDVAFILSDVTDPAKPEKIGELVMESTHVYDVTITPDQQYVLLGTFPSQQSVGPDRGSMDAIDKDAIVEGLDLQPPVFKWRDACTGQETILDGPEQGLPFASGVVLVDISNPRVPAIADFRFFPVLGAHSVMAVDFDGGRTLVLATVLNLVHEISYYVFMEILATPAGPKLLVLSTYNNVGQEGEVFAMPDPVGGGHDAYMQKHPVTDEWLAYLAYGPSGMVIVNIDDPMQPTFVSQWKDWGVLGSHTPGDPYMHSALPMEELWEGRHYTIMGEECLNRRSGMPSCAIFIFDTTEPSAPEFVSAWALPVDTNWRKPLDYSTHYYAVHNRTLFITVYHAGLWAIDLSTPEALATMPSIGAYLPTNLSPKPAVIGNRVPGYPTDYTPIVLELTALADGTLVLFDATSGLYTVRFDASYPAPSPPPWPLGFNE